MFEGVFSPDLIVIKSVSRQITEGSVSPGESGHADEETAGVTMKSAVTGVWVPALTAAS